MSQENILKNQELGELFSAISKLKDAKECKNFLRDLCTLSELKAMSERFQVVKNISKNVPYRKISKITGASTATITRVAHWFHHGMGGYRLLLERLKI